MDRAHTKGPWRATRDCFGDFTIQPQNEELAIAAVVNGEMRRMGGLFCEHEANAHLIAAAPELLAALRSFVGAGDWEDAARPGQAMTGRRVSYGLLRQAAAAIAKAEGRAILADATPNHRSPSMEGR